MLKTAIHLFPFLTILACDSGTEVKIGTTNSPPSVTMLSPGDGESFNEDSIIHFHAKVSDSYDSPSELTIFWGSDVQGELNSEALLDSLGDLMFSTANLEVGVHVVTLTALDTDGAQTQASVGVEIIDLPEDPTIDVIQPTDEDSAIEGYPFTLLVQTWDARDEFNTLAVTMESDQDGEICQTNPGSNGVAECDALLTAGAHLLTFTVVNSAEFEAQATAYFEVISILDIMMIQMVLPRIKGIVTTMIPRSIQVLQKWKMDWTTIAMVSPMKGRTPMMMMAMDLVRTKVIATIMRLPFIQQP